MQLQEKHTVFVRAERVQKNELFPEGGPRAGDKFDVGELSVGYRFDLFPEPIEVGSGKRRHDD